MFQPFLGTCDRTFTIMNCQATTRMICRKGAQRLQVLMKQVPDLRVDVRDVIADGDKVVVRAVWLGTDAVSQRRVEFHGFVQWKIVDGKFAERWATVTPLAELPEG